MNGAKRGQDDLFKIDKLALARAVDWRLTSYNFGY